MNKKNGTKVGFIAAAIALLVVTMAVPAGAGNLENKVSGDYVNSAFYSCATTSFGESGSFNPDTLVRTGSGYNISGSVQGVYSFDGHGGYTYTGKVLAVSNDPTDTPVSQYNMFCYDGTYTVEDDLNVETRCDVVLFPTAGYLYNHSVELPGFFFVIKGGAQRGKMIGTMENIIMLRSDTEKNVERILPYGLETIPQLPVVERICTTSGTAMKVTGQSKN